jgi:phosphoribosylformylglycinamidine synthase
MLAVVDPARLDEVRAECERWDLPCAVVAEVADHGDLRAYVAGALVGAIPARLLTDETPRYELAQTERDQPPHRRPRDRANDEPKTWVFEQYDHLVGSRTVRRPGFDAAVLRLDDTRGLAVSLDGPPLGEDDPFLAGWEAVMEAALNVACGGGEPLGLTDCLNLGNPERAEVGWELTRVVEGIAQAAIELGIPVVSGNVSLYNETRGRPIPPTPVVGCVGLVRDVTRIPSRWRRGDRVFLLRGAGAQIVRFVWQNAHRFSLAHDISDGGVDAALLEAAAWSGVEARLEAQPSPGPGVIVATERRPEWRDTIELGAV